MLDKPRQIRGVAGSISDERIVCRHEEETRNPSGVADGRQQLGVRVTRQLTTPATLHQKTTHGIVPCMRVDIAREMMIRRMSTATGFGTQTTLLG